MHLNQFPDSSLAFMNALPQPFRKYSFSALRRAYKGAAKIAATTIDIDFGSGVSIRAPLAHPSVYWRYRPSLANRNFLLLAQLIAAERPGAIIDVGANIGDGAAMLRGNGVEEPLLLIEGSKTWYDLMVENTASFAQTTCVEAMLGEMSLTIAGALEETRGTGKMVAGSGETQIHRLDDIFTQAQMGAPLSYLKTDTDGYDVKVLRGATGLLEKYQPVVFAECAEGLSQTQGDSVADMFTLMQEAGYEHAAIWDHEGNWIGMRAIADGVEDLLGEYPGGVQETFFDTAFLAPEHQSIYKALIKYSGVAH